ncbi:MAG: DUF4367 domain-containing protein [Oscillospiraceae bacterium]|nr:DUF4367 domain-containing protein [Oscillospiraceae bacterium]
MKQVLLSDELMKEAARLAHEKWLNSFPAPEDCEHEFPEGFYESLLREGEKRQKRRTNLRRAAVILIAFLLSGALLLASSPAVRAMLKSWVREVFGQHVVYHFDKDSTLAELPDYELSYIPENFKEISRFPKTIGRALCYGQRKEGKAAIFFYYLISEDRKIRVNYDKGDTPEDVMIHSLSGAYYPNCEVVDIRGNYHRCLELDIPFDFYIVQTNALVWMDEKEEIIFVIVGNLEKDEILHMAEGVVLE